MKTKFTYKENIGSGLALVLIFLFIGLKWDHAFLIKISFAVILLLMISPAIFYPISIIWMNLSDLLGKYVSKFILSIIFFLFVMPVGFIRKLSGKDNLQIKQFKKSKESAFFERNHIFSAEDMKNPY